MSRSRRFGTETQTVNNEEELRGINNLKVITRSLKKT